MSFVLIDENKIGVSGTAPAEFAFQVSYARRTTVNGSPQTEAPQRNRVLRLPRTVTTQKLRRLERGSRPQRDFFDPQMNGRHRRMLTEYPILSANASKYALLCPPPAVRRATTCSRRSCRVRSPKVHASGRPKRASQSGNILYVEGG